MISPNVIITRDFKTIQSIFFEPKDLGPNKKSLTEVLEDLKGDNNSLICAPGSNNTLIELDFNIPNKSPNGYINAQFVESNEIIEYFLLESSPLQTQFNTIYSLFSQAGVQLNESLGKLNKFYIAFGTGDNLNEWAGPFVCTLGTANIILENNVKVITLGFVCGELESVRSYTQKLYGTLGFEDEKLNASVPKDSSVKYIVEEELKYGLHPTKGPRRNPSKRIETERVFQKVFTWNTFIRRLLTNYLGKVYGGFKQNLSNRVMVLLDEDFDEILNKNVEGSTSKDFFRNYQGKLRDLGIKLRARNPKAVTNDRRRNRETFKNKEVDREGGIFASRRYVENNLETKLGFEENNGREVYGRAYNLDEKEISFIANQQGGESLLKYYNSYHKTQGDGQAIKEIPTDYQELVDADFLLTKAIIKMESEIKVDPLDKSPDLVLDPIFNFIGGLRKYTGSVKDYVLFELNDAEIISLLDGAMTRVGMSTPGGGPGTPRIVFGDSRLIKRLIFLSDRGVSNLSKSFGKTFTDPVIDKMDWEGYREEFKSTISARERIQNSSFNEKIDFGPYTPSFKNLDLKDIIFLHGVKNSNVQSISFKKDIVRGALLDFNVKARQRGPFTNTFIRKAVRNDDFKFEELINYFDDKGIFDGDVAADPIRLTNFLESLKEEDAAVLSGIEDRTGTNLIAKGRSGSKEDLLNYINLIVGYKKIMDEYSDNPELEINYLDDQSTDNPRGYESVADLRERMSQLVVNLDIKTLPFFNQKFYFNKQCYLFSMYNHVNRSFNDLNQTKPATFLNGHYLIKGARHYMSAQEAYSEFELVKTQPEKDKVDPDTEEIIKDVVSETAEQVKKAVNSLPQVTKPITPDPDGTRFGKKRGPTTPNPRQADGTLRFPGKPETDLSGNLVAPKPQRKEIAKRKQAQLNPNKTLSYQTRTTANGTMEISQGSDQNAVERSLLRRRDEAYKEYIERKNNSSGRSARLQRQKYLLRKKVYDSFMFTKKQNNGVIPTFDPSNAPLR